MTSNIVNQVAFLRTTRNFPEDPHQLCVEINKSYVDIAGAVNSRTIGIFPVNRAAQDGEQWFIKNNQRQQGFRQVYTFTAAGAIPHNLNFNTIALFTKPFGSYTDGTNYYGAIYAGSVAIAGQVTFYITPTNIMVVRDPGAPVITSGIIVLEWISQV